MPQINLHIKGTDKVIRADESNVAAMLADLRQRYQPLKQFAQDSLGGVSPFSAPVDWKGTLERYEHKEYASPFDGIPEAFAQGVYEAPGQLVALFDEFSPWAKVYNTIQGKTLQERVDEALGANELGYNPADYKGSETLQGAARLAGNIVGDPLNVVPAGMVGKAGAKQVASTIADEAGRTTMRNQLGMIQSGYEKGKIYDTAGNAYTPTGAHGWRLQGYPITREEADALEQQGFNTFREAYKGPETTGLEGWFARDHYNLPDNIKSREAWKFGKDNRMDNDLGFVSNDYFQAGEPLGNLGAFKSQLGAVDTLSGLLDNSGMKFYHGTSKDAADSILENGFELSDITTARDRDRIYEGLGGYVFDNYEDAEDFALNQGFNNQAVIEFELNPEELLRDLEYGDNAFIMTKKPTNPKLVWSQEY